MYLSSGLASSVRSDPRDTASQGIERKFGIGNQLEAAPGQDLAAQRFGHQQLYAGFRRIVFQRHDADALGGAIASAALGGRA